MKYEVGQKVKIKSLDWYNKNKNKRGDISFPYEAEVVFASEMSSFCGQIVTISQKSYTQDIGFYRIREDDDIYMWTDEMIEGLVEEETKPNIIEEAKTYWDSIKDAWICPEGYIFKDENGNVINATKIVLEKKKNEYLKTYCECKDILGLWDIDDTERGYYKTELIDKLQMLLICRDAYWKLAGEEMGLGKPWEPDWNHLSDKWVLFYTSNRVWLQVAQTRHSVFAFPTPEMRDAFHENFKELIENCKELL